MKIVDAKKTAAAIFLFFCMRYIYLEMIFSAMLRAFLISSGLNGR